MYSWVCVRLCWFTARCLCLDAWWSFPARSLGSRSTQYRSIADPLHTQRPSPVAVTLLAEGVRSAGDSPDCSGLLEPAPDGHCGRAPHPAARPHTAPAASPTRRPRTRSVRRDARRPVRSQPTDRCGRPASRQPRTAAVCSHVSPHTVTADSDSCTSLSLSVLSLVNETTNDSLVHKDVVQRSTHNRQKTDLHSVLTY